MLYSLDRVLNQVRSQPNWKSLRYLETLQTLWPQVVGDVVAAQTFPVKLQRQVLSVAVSTPAWGQNLTYQRQLILKKLNTHLDTPIRDIRFSPGAWQQAQQSQRDRLTGNNESAPVLPESWRSRDSNAPPPPEDATEAFQRWAARVKQVHQEFPRCPTCYRPAPTAELERWYVCGFCRQQQQSLAGLPSGRSLLPSASSREVGTSHA
ncbi:MAG: DUF721 domain-containing protein [Cyanobacteria bacterium P01_D01_bin.123]